VKSTNYEAPYYVISYILMGIHIYLYTRTQNILCV